MTIDPAAAAAAVAFTIAGDRVVSVATAENGRGLETVSLLLDDGRRIDIDAVTVGYEPVLALRSVVP